jgi:DNA repair protein RadC
MKTNPDQLPEEGLQSRPEQLNLDYTATAGNEAPSGEALEMPVYDQPRSRLERLGTDSLTDAELLSVLLGMGSNARAALSLAENLLESYGSLNQLARQNVSEIARTHGIGQAKATALKAAFGLQERLCRPVGDRSRLDHPHKIYELMKGRLNSQSVEVLYGLALDSKLHLVRAYPITSGLVNQTLVHAREVYREAISSAGTAHLVLLHAHPSGDPAPSADDIRVTRQMHSAGQILGIPLIDHVIVGRPSTSYPSGYLSMKEADLIDFAATGACG